MQSLREDATTALLRAIRHAVGCLVWIVVDEIRSRSWASATFAGARHDILLRFEGEGAQAAAARLGEQLASADFPLRGHLLADAVVSEGKAGECGGGGAPVRLRIEALTVEDGPACAGQSSGGRPRRSAAACR